MPDFEILKKQIYVYLFQNRDYFSFNIHVLRPIAFYHRTQKYFFLWLYISMIMFQIISKLNPLKINLDHKEVLSHSSTLAYNQKRSWCNKVWFQAMCLLIIWGGSCCARYISAWGIDFQTAPNFRVTTYMDLKVLDKSWKNPFTMTHTFNKVHLKF